MSIDQYQDMKKRELQEKKMTEKEQRPLPGMLARKPQMVLTRRMYQGGFDDAQKVFTPRRWARMPVSPPERWWEELPTKWEEIMPEWGAKVQSKVCDMSFIVYF